MGLSLDLVGPGQGLGASVRSLCDIPRQNLCRCDPSSDIVNLSQMENRAEFLDLCEHAPPDVVDLHR